jgi:sialate O-acetylesterase
MLLSSPVSRNAVLKNDAVTPGDFVRDSLDLIRFWDIVYHPKNETDKIITQPTYDDSSWKDLDMPKTFPAWGMSPYEGIVWLQKTIDIPENFNLNNLTINLGHPEMNYSLYLNGNVICKTIWNANPIHKYTIPADYIHKGKNTISVRMAVLWGGGGFNPPAGEMYLSDGNTKISMAGNWKYRKDLEPAVPVIHNYHYYPGFLFNAMIHPVIPYGLKGFIWYQGEANDSLAFNYRTLFPMLITDWRIRWQQGTLPFLFVQLPNYKKRQPEPVESEWAELREAQAMALSRPNTGMVCTIDLGEAESIHPLNKQDVGFRLALQAEKTAYGKDVVASGPMFSKYRVDGKSIRISFSDNDSGLKTTDMLAPREFTMAGPDKKFYLAKAQLHGNEIIVTSGYVNDPVAVRYAWSDNPACNLINTEGFPAVPFRTDTWKGITEK